MEFVTFNFELFFQVVNGYRLILTDVNQIRPCLMF